MNNKKFLLVALILVALVQLFIPAKMIYERENILKEGKEFKFRIAPVDPNDPFRGKYFALDFIENTFDVQSDSTWVINETVFVILNSDNKGFATIKTVSKVKPANGQDFVKSRVRSVIENGISMLIIDYPFNRFYLEESKAMAVDTVFRKSLIDTNQVTYALVKIKDGEAVLKDVLINDIPVREIRK